MLCDTFRGLKFPDERSTLCEVRSSVGLMFGGATAADSRIVLIVDWVLDWGILKKLFNFVCTTEGLEILVGGIVVGAVAVRIFGFAAIDGKTCFDPDLDIEIMYGSAITRFPFAGITLVKRSHSK